MPTVHDACNSTWKRNELGSKRSKKEMELATRPLSSGSAEAEASPEIDPGEGDDEVIDEEDPQQ